MLHFALCLCPFPSFRSAIELGTIVRSCHEPCLSIVDPYVPLLASIFVYSVRNAFPLSKPVSHMRTPETPMSLQLEQNKRSEEKVLRRCACAGAGVKEKENEICVY
ncbi:expressed protein [Echinococcus multilocularis]|uniref:Expressed protein n=1 Tax=Echinococcus multilocularis TaxID=6211 RepID=A0A087W138_ECHMU|nr:expressed protein [Echinococcus multilocularis]